MEQLQIGWMAVVNRVLLRVALLRTLPEDLVGKHDGIDISVPIYLLS